MNGDLKWQIKHSATTVDGSPCFYCVDLKILGISVEVFKNPKDHGYQISSMGHLC